MILLLLLFFISPVYGKIAGPLYTHEEREQKEFEHLYAGVNLPPAVTVGHGAPTSRPNSIGDIFVSTTTSKVYIATGTLNSGSWTVIN